MLDRFSTRSKLIIGFGTPLLLLAVVSIGSRVYGGRLARKTQELETRTVAHADLARRMQLHVFDMQQWITDICANAGAAQPQEALRKVAANREAFLAGARDFREYIQSGANGARLRDLDEIERDFRCFDDLGAKMTEAYAAGGAARGLALMADYDEAAADSASFAGDAGFARKLIAALLQATRRPPGSRSIARPEFAPPPAAEHCAGVIGIGASTGGTNALAVLFGALPADLPGVVVVQHMPKNFTRAFARRLNDLSALEIREADDGDPVRPGTALIAPGDRHLVLEGARPRFCVRLVDGPPINHQRPSVDALFRSMAQRAGTLAVGLLLTGMGGDGARGLLEILERGGRTIAQDEKTSVIFGMPREAIRLGAAERIAPLPMMAPLLVSMFRSRDRARSA